jgi:hypothetical protein
VDRKGPYVILFERSRKSGRRDQSIKEEVGVKRYLRLRTAKIIKEAIRIRKHPLSRRMRYFVRHRSSRGAIVRASFPNSPLKLMEGHIHRFVTIRQT